MTVHEVNGDARCGNSFEHPDDVAVRRPSGTDAAATSMSAFAPHSFTLLEMTLA